MSARWPEVVTYLFTTLPNLPGWGQVAVYDTDAITDAAPASYAIVGKTSDDNTSGNYVRMIEPSMMVMESGTVRVHIVTRTGDPDPAGVRTDGFALISALEDALMADQDLGGVLGQIGTVDLTVDVLSFSDQRGIGQSLIVS